MRTKRNPLNEGSLREIFDLFLKPITKKWGIRNKNKMVFLDWLFDVENREIRRWRVVKTFNIPGLLYIAGSIKIQGIGYREVKSGVEMWVRTDKRSPNSIDVEWQGGQGGADLVYNLSREQWYFVQKHLICIDKG